MSRRKTTKDPHAKREAEKYENPIVSREFILIYLNDLGRPASFAQLLKGLKVTKGDDK